MIRFTNKGHGAFEPPEDSRDFKREHFFGAKVGRQVLKEFDHSLIYPPRNQGQTMSCGYFSGIRLLEIKFFLTTGKKLSISDEQILELWDKGTALGFGDKRLGSYIYDILKFLQKHPQTFMDEDGNEVKVWVDKYFDLANATEEEFWEEIYYGGGVLTGTSSRIGLILSKAKYRPYIPETRKQPVSDGHAFPVMGKGYKWREFVARVWQNKSDDNAAVHPNSWGAGWGDGGKFYTKADQRSRLFRCWGFTIGFEYAEQTDTTPTPPEPKEMLFKDVSENSWAYNAIKYVKDKGYFKGYDDGTFRPDQPITRAEMAVVIERLMKK